MFDESEPIRVILLSQKPYVSYHNVVIPINTRTNAFHLLVYVADQWKLEYEREKLALTILNEKSNSRAFSDTLFIMNKFFEDAGLEEKLLHGQKTLQFERHLVWVDAHEFVRQAKKIITPSGQMSNSVFVEEVEAALRLYDGHFMQDQTFETDDLIDWQGIRQQELATLYHELLDELIQYYLYQGAFHEAQGYADLWANSLDPGVRALEYLLWLSIKRRRFASVQRYLTLLRQYEIEDPLIWKLNVERWQSLVDNDEDPPLSLLRMRPRRQSMQFVPNERVIERSGTQVDLIKQLTNPNSPPVIGLIGLPGVGKTQFARQIVSSLRERNDGFEFAWVELTPNLDFELLLNLVLTQLNLEQFLTTPYSSKQKKFKQMIRGRQCVIAIDEGTSSRFVDAAFFAKLLDLFDSVQLLLIARQIPSTIHYPVQLVGFDSDQVRHFLVRQIPELSQVDSAVFTAVTAITGGLPLALNWVVGFVSLGLSRLTGFAKALSKLEDATWTLETAVSNYDYILNWLWQNLLIDEKNILYTVSIFDPFDGMTRADVMIIADSAFVVKDQVIDEKLQRLVDLNILQVDRQSDMLPRYTLHPITNAYIQRHSLQMQGTFQMVAIQRAYIQHFLNFATVHQHDFAALDSHKTNLIRMFELVLLQNLHPHLQLETVTALNDLYEYLDKRGLYSVAQQLLSNALNLPEISVRERVRLLHNIGSTFLKQGALDNAEASFNSAYSLAESLESFEGYSTLLRDLGRVFIQKGAYDTALEYLNAGRERSESQQQWFVYAQITANIGVIMERIGRYAEAKAYFQQISHILRTQETIDIASIETQDLNQLVELALGRIENVNSNYPESAAHLQRSLDIARKINHPERISWCYLNLGVLDYYLSDFEGALEYFTQGAVVAEYIQHNELLTWFEWNMGAIHVLLDNFSLARRLLQTSLNHATQLGLNWMVPEMLLWFGILHFRQTQMEPARKYFKKILEHSVVTARFASLALFGLSLINRFDNSDFSMEADLTTARRQIISEIEAVGLDRATLPKITRKDMKSAESYFQIALKEIPDLHRFNIVEVVGEWLPAEN